MQGLGFGFSVFKHRLGKEKGGMIGKADQITEETLLISLDLNFIIKKKKRQK